MILDVIRVSLFHTVFIKSTKFKLACFNLIFGLKSSKTILINSNKDLILSLKVLLKDMSKGGKIYFILEILIHIRYFFFFQMLKKLL